MAFNTIDYDIILDNLWCLGVAGTVLQWVPHLLGWAISIGSLLEVCLMDASLWNATGFIQFSLLFLTSAWNHWKRSPIRLKYSVISLLIITSILICARDAVKVLTLFRLIMTQHPEAEPCAPAPVFTLDPWRKIEILDLNITGFVTIAGWTEGNHDQENLYLCPDSVAMLVTVSIWRRTKKGEESPSKTDVMHHI